MYDSWHVLSETNADFPASEQEIYCCIYDGVSITEVRKVIANVKVLEDLLSLHPSWKIFWQPMPGIPNPPPDSVVFFFGKEVPYGKHTY